jgi:CBS domain-containing protein
MGTRGWNDDAQEKMTIAPRIRDVMQPDPVCLPATASVTTAAKAMREAGIGDVIVQDNEQVCGIVTDRDIVIRVVAEERSPNAVAVGEICSRDLASVFATDSFEDAVRLMAQYALRRLPVLDDGRPVGIVSLGDLAIEADPSSALALISSAPPNT